MFRASTVALAGSLSLALAACSAPATPTGSSAPAPAASTPAPAAAAAATPSTSQVSAATTPTAAAQPAAAVVVPAGSLTYTIAADKSEARYRVREQLANIASPVEAVGVTKALTGTMVFDPNGKIVPGASKWTIDVSTLKSDQNNRDNYLRRNALETNKYPKVEFVPTEVTGLTWPLPASGTANLQITGDMTVREITKPVTWEVTADINGPTVTGKGTTNFTFGTFGMTTPRTMMVLSVVDNIQLEFDFTMTRES